MDGNTDLRSDVAKSPPTHHFENLEAVNLVGWVAETK
jgi:hypothetical protein